MGGVLKSDRHPSTVDLAIGARGDLYGAGHRAARILAGIEAVERRAM